MRACRLDGLNKELGPWDTQFYMGEFRSLCAKEKMIELNWPAREYVIQIARFDPSKGIPNVIDSYAHFRALLRALGTIEEEEMPQLLVCGHGAVDDPDASTWCKYSFRPLNLSNANILLLLTAHPTLNRHSPPEVVANFKRRVPPR